MVFISGIVKKLRKKCFSCVLREPPVQWVPGALSLGVKRPGREADHLPPSSAEIKECVAL
jgi:hypothetical protein